MFEMNSAVNPPNTIEEENEGENPEENDDFGSEEDSQNESASDSENSYVEQEVEDNQEDEGTLVQREEDSGDQEESTHSEQEDDDNNFNNQETEDTKHRGSRQNTFDSLEGGDRRLRGSRQNTFDSQEEEDRKLNTSFDNQEEEDDEEEEEKEEEEKEIEEKEKEEEEPEPPPVVRNRRSYHRPRQQPITSKNRPSPRSMYSNRGQQRQRKRWVSPQRANPHLRNQRTREYKASYMDDPLSLKHNLSQLDSIKDELSNVVQESVAKADYVNDLEQKVKTMEIDNSQLHRINVITEKKLESFQKNLAKSHYQCDSLTSELHTSKSEIDKLKKSVKEGTNACSNLEKKLVQATNEIEKTKTELQKCKEHCKEQENSYLKKIDDMLKFKKKMEKQNFEMHKVIKKHMQLIANLRRQVMHVEASAALKISEDQFMKAMEKHY